MRLLLDTHVFIWAAQEPHRLSVVAQHHFQDPTTTLILSVASVWEMEIKQQLGKLVIKMPIEQVIESQRQTNQLEVMPIWLEHALTVEKLPMHHKDPFDRILVAQASFEGISILSADPHIRKYAVNVLW